MQQQQEIIELRKLILESLRKLERLQLKNLQEQQEPTQHEHLEHKTTISRINEFAKELEKSTLK